MNRIMDEQTLTHIEDQYSHTIFAYLMATGPRHPDWLIVLADGESPNHESGDPNDPVSIQTYCVYLSSGGGWSHFNGVAE